LETDYIDINSIFLVKCKHHGITFIKKVSHLLDNLNCCPICITIRRKEIAKKHWKNKIGGYDCHSVNLTPNKSAILYLIEVSDVYEKFFKVGITCSTMKLRIKEFIKKGYIVKIIIEQKMILREAFNLEQNILKNNKNISYVPYRQFSGYTECFSEIPLIR